MRSGGKNRKSVINATTTEMAVIFPICEFMVNPENASTENPTTNTSEVTHNAVPTVWNE